MDFFDTLSIMGEAYCNIKNDMNHNDDYVEVLAKNFVKGKAKIDKLYDDEIKKINKRSDRLRDLLK